MTAGTAHAARHWSVWHATRLDRVELLPNLRVQIPALAIVGPQATLELAALAVRVAHLDEVDVGARNVVDALPHKATRARVRQRRGREAAAGS